MLDLNCGEYLSLCQKMMTMLLSAIFFLFASTLTQEDDCTANPNSPSCDDPVEQTICQLSCDRASDTCSQSDETKCAQIGVDVTSETHTDMFSTRCKQICSESRDADAANTCRFYKVSVSSSRVSLPPPCETTGLWKGISLLLDGRHPVHSDRTLWTPLCI